MVFGHVAAFIVWFAAISPAAAATQNYFDYLAICAGKAEILHLSDKVAHRACFADGQCLSLFSIYRYRVSCPSGHIYDAPQVYSRSPHPGFSRVRTEDGMTILYVVHTRRVPTANRKCYKWYYDSCATCFEFKCWPRNAYSLIKEEFAHRLPAGFAPLPYNSEIVTRTISTPTPSYQPPKSVEQQIGDSRWGTIWLLIVGFSILFLLIRGTTKVSRRSHSRSDIMTTTPGGNAAADLGDSDYLELPESAGADQETCPASKSGWFSDVFDNRTSAAPRQGFFESNKDYRDRVYLQGKERLIEDITGSKPRQGWLESDEEYQSRIAHEANEHIVESATVSTPRQGWLESDDDYRSRVHHEASERIIEGATGSTPRQGWFESNESYHDRVSQEANEHIVEAATGSAPRQGWFESDEDYSARVNQEAKEIKASKP
ncbi:MAG: hypothetical protein ACRECX_07830 [Methyloceanibacter sp.]|uniref:hypothetical protein n=1 Tax=Methyloceanibacter sp. TaxID=1965321 RepID=UPI003D6D22F8